MKEERIALSAKERERLKVLHEVERGHLRQIDAAGRLRLSDRQVRRLLERVGKVGDRGLVHGLRGRPSNRKISADLEQRSLRRLRLPAYLGFGPTLAAEHLARHGLRVSRETLRKWMNAAGLRQSRRRKWKPVHVWRPRRPAFGELVMMDSSPYRWLEDRGPACHLIAMIDDTSSRVWGRFALHDSSEENLRTLGGWLRRYGRPLALYTDKNGLSVTSRPVQWREQLHDTPPRTQFGRALAELAIGKSFRPTASRPCRSKTKTSHHNQNQTHSTPRSPLEEIMEADISTLRKTGHFYFALRSGEESQQGRVI